MDLTRRRLRVLGYPKSDAFHPSKLASVVHVVAYLEDQHIRQWPVEKRSPLREEGEGWGSVFVRYLRDAECPFAPDLAPSSSASSSSSTAVPPSFTPEELHRLVQWLLGQAICVDFEESAEELNCAAQLALSGLGAESPSRTSSGGGGGEGDGEVEEEKTVSKEIAGLVRQLEKVLGLESGDGVMSELEAARRLRAAGRELRMSVLPRLAEEKRLAAREAVRSARTGGGEGRSGEGGKDGEYLEHKAHSHKRPKASASAAASHSSSAAPTIDDFNPGIHSGDEKLDRAVAALRMLYLADLRELQDNCNEILEIVQEFTADPKTNASLGKVGR